MAIRSDDQTIKRLTAAKTRRAIARHGIERSMLEGFGFSDAALRHRYAFHRHTRHQLLSPQAGMLLVETAEAVYVVAPAQAVWIPAGTRHATTIGDAPACSLFFSPAKYSSPSESLRVFPSSPLLRELLVFGAGGPALPRVLAGSVFDLLHFLCLEAMQSAPAVSLPRPRSERFGKVVDALLENLDTATPAGLARAGGMSARTFRRRFREELGLTAERYIQQARLAKAMTLLLEPARRHTITEIALQAGYQNHSAFSAAFRRFTRKSPIEFRRMGGRQGGLVGTNQKNLTADKEDGRG